MTRLHTRLAALAAFLFVVALPRIAAACPACAGREGGSGYTKVIILGAFMVFPFAVAYVVVRVIKRLPPEAGPVPGQRGDSEQ